MSKYRNKQQVKTKVFKQGEPSFTYTSKCCDAPANKKACAKGNGEPDDRGFFLSPLGTWNCTRCRRKCSVSRTVRKKVEVGETQEASLAHVPLSDLQILESARAV